MKPSKEDLQLLRLKWQGQVDSSQRDQLDMALIYIVEKQHHEILDKEAYIQNLKKEVEDLETEIKYQRQDRLETEHVMEDKIESLKSLLRRATLIARQVHKDAYNLAHYTNDWFKDLSQIDSTFQDKL